MCSNGPMFCLCFFLFFGVIHWGRIKLKIMRHPNGLLTDEWQKCPPSKMCVWQQQCGAADTNSTQSVGLSGSMVCSSWYGMPHELPQDLSHQSTMREWASSQAVCHSFILALLGMVIGSQSTSNRWIGRRPGWLSVAAVYARVHSFVCALVRAHPACMLLSSRTTAHLFHSISSVSFEFWILSVIASTAVPCRWLVGCRVGRIPVKKCSRLSNQIIKIQLNVIPLEMSIQDDTIRSSPVWNE